MCVEASDIISQARTALKVFFCCQTKAKIHTVIHQAHKSIDLLGLPTWTQLHKKILGVGNLMFLAGHMFPLKNNTYNHC